MHDVVMGFELVPMDTLSLKLASSAVRIERFSFSSLDGTNNHAQTSRGSWELIISDSYHLLQLGRPETIV